MLPNLAPVPPCMRLRDGCWSETFLQLTDYSALSSGPISSPCTRPSLHYTTPCLLCRRAWSAMAAGPRRSCSSLNTLSQSFYLSSFPGFCWLLISYTCVPFLLCRRAWSATAAGLRPSCSSQTPSQGAPRPCPWTSPSLAHSMCMACPRGQPALRSSPRLVGWELGRWWRWWYFIVSLTNFWVAVRTCRAPEHSKQSH